MKGTFTYKNVDTETSRWYNVPGCEVLTGEVSGKHKAREMMMKEYSVIQKNKMTCSFAASKSTFSNSEVVFMYYCQIVYSSSPLQYC
jgi:hypothetical protein